jgi:hypothetical protein
LNQFGNTMLSSNEGTSFLTRENAGLRDAATDIALGQRF